MKDIYKEVKAFLKIKTFPDDAPDYYTTPLFDEVSLLV